jgi:hypothetical protein
MSIFPSRRVFDGNVATFRNLPGNGTWGPAANGLIAWSFDPIANSGAAGPTGGVLYLVVVQVPAPPS